MSGAAAAAQVGLSVASSMYAARQQNAANKRANTALLNHLGKATADIALQEQQQINQLRDAAITVRQQGSQQGGIAKAMALAGDTFGDSVQEQQQAIQRSVDENLSKLDRSTENTRESADRMIQSTIDDHLARIKRLGSSGLIEGLMTGVGEGIKSGTINENTPGKMKDAALSMAAEIGRLGREYGTKLNIPTIWG